MPLLYYKIRIKNIQLHTGTITSTKGYFEIVPINMKPAKVVSLLQRFIK